MVPLPYSYKRADSFRLVFVDYKLKRFAVNML